jgi:hypothetical protein
MKKISQSMMKAYTDYLVSRKLFLEEKQSDAKSCGLLFKGQYIDDTVKSEPSDAMLEGIYFEFLCTGVTGRDGKIPEPDRTRTGELTTPYKRVQEAANLFKQIIEHYKIEITSVGEVISTSDCTGILDIKAIWNGQKCVIDLKYSGLIDDKWSDLGWNDESLHMKDSLMIQGVHYKMILKESEGIEYPFYYFIFNSKDPSDMKIIEEKVDAERFANHKQMVQKVKNSIEKELKTGFMTLPNYKLCKKCPLKETCEHREHFPKVKEIYY